MKSTAPKSLSLEVRHKADDMFYIRDGQFKKNNGMPTKVSGLTLSSAVLAPSKPTVWKVNAGISADFIKFIKPRD